MSSSSSNKRQCTEPIDHSGSKLLSMMVLHHYVNDEEDPNKEWKRISDEHILDDNGMFGEVDVIQKRFSIFAYHTDTFAKVIERHAAFLGIKFADVKFLVTITKDHTLVYHSLQAPIQCYNDREKDEVFLICLRKPIVYSRTLIQ